jgi:putative ABC transport system permease protein
MKRIPRLSFGRADIRRDVERELRLHIELRTEELIALGLARDEARRQAEASFGNINELAAACDEIRRAREKERRRRGVMDALMQDVRYAARVLLRAPGFTATALLTLALGIGGSAAIFSVVNALLLRPLPFSSRDGLVFITERNPAHPDESASISKPLADDIAARAHTLEAAGMYGMRFNARTVIGGEPVFIPGAVLNAGVFSTLDPKPELGRLFGPENYRAGGPPAALISHDLWVRAFAGDATIVGRMIQLGSSKSEVIGVLPSTFSFPAEGIDVWLPDTGEWPPNFANRAVHVFSVVARVKPGVTLDQVRTELQTIYQQGQQEQPGSDAGHEVTVTPLRDALVGNVRASVLIVFGAVLVVLLITCGNIAGLQLARAAARAPELALRTALGAGRFAVTRQLLVESALLGIAGCSAGIALAYIALPWLVASYPQNLPFRQTIHLSGAVLVFATVVGLLAVLVFGLLPALVATRSRTSAASALVSGRSTMDRRRHALRSALVSAELALSLVLVVGAALVVRSFMRLQGENPGFRPDGLLIAEITPSNRVTDQQIIEFYRKLPGQIARIPGVASASAASSLPISGGDSHGSLTIEGLPFTPGREPNASYRRILPGYFRTVGIALLAGRDFDARDRGQDPKVVIVSQTLAQRHFGSAANALGHRIKVGPPENEPWVTIIGVVADVRNESMESPDEYGTYEPHTQRPWRSMQLVARAQGDATNLLPAVRSALRSVDVELVIAKMYTMEERVADSVAPRRFNAQLLTAFGLLALLLAAVGVYGIVAYLVNERKREFGIRVALGATSAEIGRLVLARAARLVLAGTLAGTVAALLLTRYLATLLFEVEPFDPASFFFALVLLALMVLAASLGPAWRAVRSDVRSALLE